MNGKKEMQKHI